MNYTANITLSSVGSTATSKAPKRKFSLLKRALHTIWAKRQAKKILKAIDEAENIHSGRIKGQSFDEFLKKI